MVISLNEAYQQKLLYYWCNSAGEVNMPGYPVSARPDPEVLPPVANNVYADFREGGTGAHEYVVTYNGETGLMFGWLFDYIWLADLGILTAGNETAVKMALHEAVKSTADVLSVGCPYPVFYGKDTDPDGDEIMVFISSDLLESDPVGTMNYKRYLGAGELLYEMVEKALKEK